MAISRPGHLAVVVVGHETYYPRFGFAPASRWNLTGDYGESDAFPLCEEADSIRDGHIRYVPEFAEIFCSHHAPRDEPPRTAPHGTRRPLGTSRGA